MYRPAIKLSTDHFLLPDFVQNTGYLDYNLYYLRQGWTRGRDQRLGRSADGPALLRRQELPGLGDRQLHHRGTRLLLQGTYRQY